MDKLSEMFELQKQLQQKLGYDDLFKNQEFINICSLGLIDEVMESIKCTRWKNWKKNQEFNEEEFKKEVIDVFHFSINLCLAAGLTPDTLYEEFTKKNKINNQRIKEGY
jgi:dimeric dUTPase (all-alpha-NTP-PPase superfamily)